MWITSTYPSHTSFSNWSDSWKGQQVQLQMQSVSEKLRLATIAELKLGHSSPVIHRVDKLILNKANSCRKVSDLVKWVLSYTLKCSSEETRLCLRLACLKTQQPTGLTTSHLGFQLNLFRSRSFHTYQ